MEGVGGPRPGLRGRRAGRRGLSHDGAQRASHLSQSEKKDPKELQDPGSDASGVSWGPTSAEASGAKGPRASALSPLLPLFIPFTTGKGFR